MIACVPKQLKVHEKNYPTYDLKLVVVLFSEDMKTLFVWGNLHYVFTIIDLNFRQWRWIKLLKDYDILIFYYPAKANVPADVLSQKIKSIASLAYLDISRHLLDMRFRP